MKILSRMLSKKDEPENPGAADMDMEAEMSSLAPRADDSGEVNRAQAPADLPPAADLSHPVMPREEEPEVAGSGWGDSAWDENDWEDDEDWGDEDDQEARRATADRKALVTEIRDAMVSVSSMRPVSEEPPAPEAKPAPDFSEDAEFGRKAMARSELRNNGQEDRILQKTDQAMTEEGSSRRRSAMAHLKAAAAATKADRVLRHVVSRDPSADPEEQSPYRDDLAKVVRPHSTSRPISRVVSRQQTNSPIWDQGEGDEDAALYAAAKDGLDADVAESVEAEMDAAEEQRIARGPMDLSEEEFADDTPAASARVESAFPSSPFAREAVPSSPVNAFGELDDEEFEDDFEEDVDFDDPHRFEVDLADEDDSAPRPSRVVSAAVAFANAPEEVEDITPPETEVRKAIWDAAEEVAADLAEEDLDDAEFAEPDVTGEAVVAEQEDAADQGLIHAVEEARVSEQPIDIASELAAAKAAAEAKAPVASKPAIPDPDPVPPVAVAPRVAPVRPQVEETETPDQGEQIGEMAANMPGRAGRSAGRVKTRLLGFQANEEKDVFETANRGSQQSETQFPAGWIVVTNGPGRGSSFTLQMGVSQIGRGEDQSIRLDFGDTSISRNNHAAVAFDEEQGKFYLGHGGKSNLVRLNGMPVLSTEEMNSGDEIRIGETTLKFVALCGEGFAWGEIGETAAE